MIYPDPKFSLVSAIAGSVLGKQRFGELLQCVRLARCEELPGQRVQLVLECLQLMLRSIGSPGRQRSVQRIQLSAQSLDRGCVTRKLASWQRLSGVTRTVNVVELEPTFPALSVAVAE